MGLSYLLDGNKNVPLTPTGNGNTSNHLNEKLQTQHVNVDDDDTSIQANMTRKVAEMVASCLTPKQVLGILRVLKAVALCFTVLTIVADTMYILFVEVIASHDVRMMAGGLRDVVMRIYGLGFSIIALAVELDYGKVVKKCSGLKPFIARGILYLFIATITGSHPVVHDYHYKSSSNQDYYDGGQQQYQQNNYDDDDDVEDGEEEKEEENEGDDENDDDDDNYRAAAAADDYYYASASSSSPYEDPIKDEIPTSAVGFQMFTSYVLLLVAIAYIICGILCFDRFTARAFLSTSDPRVTTAIPSQTPSHHQDGGGNNNSNNKSSSSTKQLENDDEEDGPERQ